MKSAYKKLSKLEVISVFACLVTIVVSICILIYISILHTEDVSINQVETSTTEFTLDQFVVESTEVTKETVPLDTTTPSEETIPETTTPETDPEESVPTGPNPDNPDTWTISLTEDEIYLLAATVWLEGRGESSECQKGICSVIVNRMTTQGKSLSGVLYAPGQFSVAGQIAYTRPDDKSLTSAKDVVVYGPTMPSCVTYFRASYYHNWSGLIQPYCSIDNTYFSHDIRLCEEEGGCMYEQEE